jgi:hypothetical protein
VKRAAIWAFKKFNNIADNHNIGNIDKLPLANLRPELVENCKILSDRLELLKKIPSGAIVAELGVEKGIFSKQILELNKPKVLHLVDLWATNSRFENLYEEVKYKFRHEIETKTVEINKGYSTEILKSFPDKYFDWVYIDTVHDYLLTKQELEICLVKVKDNGIIAGHDYTTRSRSAGVKLGVIEAVHEFCNTYNWEFIYLTLETGGHNSFALKRKN